MALVSIYDRGKIKVLDTASRKIRLLKPRSGLLTSFSNRAGAAVLGVLLVALGIFCGYLLATERMKTFEIIVMIIGILCAPLGFWMLAKARNAYRRAAGPHRFFSWDENRVLVGTTRPIGQAEIKEILRTPRPDRPAKLMALCEQVLEVPVTAIDSVGLGVEAPTLNVNKLKITGVGREILVDLDALLPSLNFSGVNGNLAFNSISQYYTRATGTAINASIGKI